jgi:hypothetical protein
MINKEFIFKGTPYQLAIFAVEFGERLIKNNPLMWQQRDDATMPYVIYPKTFGTDRDVNPISIAMVIDDPNPFMVGYLEAQNIGEGRTLVTGTFDTDDWELYCERYESLYNELNRLGMIELHPTTGKPTLKTQERAKVFKKLKDEHPEWGYDTVAMKASEVLKENVTGDTVRNAYRAMRKAYGAKKWSWERADRVR